MSTGMPAASNLLDLLRTIPLLAEMTEGDLRLLSQAFEIVRVRGGETLIHQGEVSDSLYIVIHGRLRASIRSPDGEKVLGEILRRDVIGEMGVLTGGPRSASITAVRDSLLAKLSIDSRGLVANPELLLGLARVVVRRTGLAPGETLPAMNGLVLALAGGGCRADDLEATGRQLADALSVYGATVLIDGAAAKAKLGEDIRDDNTASLINWLSELEERYTTVLFQADPEETPWTRFCCRQADRILLVADGSAMPGLDPVSGTHSRARSALILLQDQSTHVPSQTQSWRLAFPAVADIWHARRQRPGDWQRLARLLTGRAIGLALSGGGARGFAHLGVLRAMEELGIPIDVVGGTSFGAIVGALVAKELSWQEIHALFVEVFVNNPPQRDYTFPILAIGTGRKLTKALHRLYGETEINDLWRPFLCMSTNISRAVPVVHTTGPLTKWVRASLSLPGLAPPVIDNGEIYVDGCIFNNLPVDIMKERWSSQVVAVDVADEKNMTTTTPHMDVVSGWGMLLRKIVPFMEPYDLPSFPVLLQRASIVASTQELKKAKQMATVYLQPPVSGVNVLDWGRHESLIEAGYRASIEPLGLWRKNLTAGF